MILRHLFVTTLLLLLSACAAGSAADGVQSASGADPDAGALPDVTGTPGIAGDWTLTEGSGPDGALALVESHPVTLVASADANGLVVSGRSACNSYRGEVSVDDTTLSVGPVVSTRMACSPDAVMTLEAAYVQALEAVDTVAEVTADRLVLTGPDVTLVFTATGA